jgi:hypothetical protein
MLFLDSGSIAEIATPREPTASSTFRRAYPLRHTGGSENVCFGVWQEEVRR